MLYLADHARGHCISMNMLRGRCIFVNMFESTISLCFVGGAITFVNIFEIALSLSIFFRLMCLSSLDCYIFVSIARIVVPV